MNSQKQGRMIVFILGNGFDLAHGLKTRYTDFLAADPKEDLQKNIWFKHFNEKQKDIGENWFNLEREIYYTIVMTTSNSTCNNDITNLIRSSFKERNTYNEIINELYKGSKENSLRFFIDQFGKYLSEQLNDLNLTPKPKFQEFLKNRISSTSEVYHNKIMIVNFNYTDTFERLYDEYLKNKGNTDIMYYYIHGSINKNNLILGTENLGMGYEPFRIFTKEIQRFHYETNKDYQKLLKKLGETNIKGITFHIIGHSLDKVDYKILRKTLCYSGSEDNIGDINIYRYKGNESLEIIQNIEQIIQNANCEERVSLTHLETIIDDESAEEINAFACEVR